MRRAVLAFLALVAILGAAKAAPPEDHPASIPIAWKLTVEDNNKKQHPYVLSRDGGPINVDTGDWKCSYSPVKVHAIEVRYGEAVGVSCDAGKYKAATSLLCLRGAGWQSANLEIMAGSKADRITVFCAPHD